MIRFGGRSNTNWETFRRHLHTMYAMFESRLRSFKKGWSSVVQTRVSTQNSLNWFDQFSPQRLLDICNCADMRISKTFVGLSPSCHSHLTSILLALLSLIIYTLVLASNSPFQGYDDTEHAQACAFAKPLTDDSNFICCDKIIGLAGNFFTIIFYTEVQLFDFSTHPLFDKVFVRLEGLVYMRSSVHNEGDNWGVKLNGWTNSLQPREEPLTRILLAGTRVIIKVCILFVQDALKSVVYGCMTIFGDIQDNTAS